jgi:hypothetical protein
MKMVTKIIAVALIIIIMTSIGAYAYIQTTKQNPHPSPTPTPTPSPSVSPTASPSPSPSPSRSATPTPSPTSTSTLTLDEFDRHRQIDRARLIRQVRKCSGPQMIWTPNGIIRHYGGTAKVDYDYVDDFSHINPDAKYVEDFSIDEFTLLLDFIVRIMVDTTHLVNDTLKDPTFPSLKDHFSNFSNLSNLRGRLAISLAMDELDKFDVEAKSLKQHLQTSTSSIVPISLPNVLVSLVDSYLSVDPPLAFYFDSHPQQN